MNSHPQIDAAQWLSLGEWEALHIVDVHVNDDVDDDEDDEEDRCSVNASGAIPLVSTDRSCTATLRNNSRSWRERLFPRGVFF